MELNSLFRSALRSYSKKLPLAEVSNWPSYSPYFFLNFIINFVIKVCLHLGGGGEGEESRLLLEESFKEGKELQPTSRSLANRVRGR